MSDGKIVVAGSSNATDFPLPVIIWMAAPTLHLMGMESLAIA
jgi:hypothetical protein